MERTYSSNDEAMAVAHEAMWLAYQASRVAGLGALQARETTKEQFNKDYGLEADYGYGRMMKIYLRVDDKTLRFNDGSPRGDYQSWAYTYRTYSDLIDAAEKNVIKAMA